MIRIKLLTAILGLGFAVVTSSYSTKKPRPGHSWFGLVSKISIWPGTWRVTLMNLDCYYVSDWGCVAAQKDCCVLVNLWLASVIYDDGCMLTIEVPWQGLLSSQTGEFIYETY